MIYEITKEIEHRLRLLEDEQEIKIIYACESGSRAWEFASKDSDYDVRFIYIHKRDWYLSIDEGKDSINLPITDEIDLSGWDIKKTLRLLRQTNPPLLEWLDSPIVYRDIPALNQKMRILKDEYYSRANCMYHYWHLADKNYKRYLQGEQVWLKKYFYVLRPILACRWIETRLTSAPMEFNVLLDETILEGPVKTTIYELLEQKKKRAKN